MQETIWLQPCDKQTSKPTHYDSIPILDFIYLSISDFTLLSTEDKQREV